MQSTMPTPTQVGERVVLHASATGKAVLAFGDPGRILEILTRPLSVITPNIGDGLPRVSPGRLRP